MGPAPAALLVPEIDPAADWTQLLILELNIS